MNSLIDVKRYTVRSLLFSLSLTLSGLCASGQQVPAPVAPSVPSAASESQHGTDIAHEDRIDPADLAKAIQQSASPLVLQVGPRTFYDQAHILGSEYAGAAGTEAGIQSLRTRVAHTARERWIVVYCGCCPWDRCPNIRPALNELRAMGFTHVQTLYLPTSFGADWVEKGLPTEH